ncbi:MAG: TcpQ domain-containing protein [Pseudomonadota bacterium]|nr:toxin co-regulated pilus biosynthesis Q family protein [Alphaproteobacteria bacterium]MED5424157.1 TcpQ domain-containing protein [Pseudomonadota bacterium]MEE3322870.1 TcpQ domain-containing protein [Pseudomonadota bacterium]
MARNSEAVYTPAPNVVAEHKAQMFAPTPVLKPTKTTKAVNTTLSADIYKHEAFRARLWRAYKGASLYEVAKVWCEEADVALIWNAPKSMALKETISTRSPFVEVIEDLLNQYNDKPYNIRGIMSVNETHNKPQLIVISQ